MRPALAPGDSHIGSDVAGLSDVTKKVQSLRVWSSTVYKQVITLSVS